MSDCICAISIAFAGGEKQLVELVAVPNLSANDSSRFCMFLDSRSSRGTVDTSFSEISAPMEISGKRDAPADSASGPTAESGPANNAWAPNCEGID